MDENFISASFVGETAHWLACCIETPIINSPKTLCVSRSVMPVSLQPHGLQPSRLLYPWDSPGKNTGVDSLLLNAVLQLLSDHEVLVTSLFPFLSCLLGNSHLVTFSTSLLSRLEKALAPTPVLSPGKSHGWRSLVGCSPWGREESDTTERLHFHSSLSCMGEGNGNPLQCPCLENPRDRGDWGAALYGVAQSWTRLKRLSSGSNRHHTCPRFFVLFGPRFLIQFSLFYN